MDSYARRRKVNKDKIAGNGFLINFGGFWRFMAFMIYVNYCVVYTLVNFKEGINNLCFILIKIHIIEITRIICWHAIY